jgi:Formylmethanofuran dehydrogenase subunit C
MSLILTLREQAPASNDLRGLTPRLLGALTPDAAARQPLSPSPGAAAIGTLFMASDNGRDNPELLIVRTGARRLDGLGRGLDGGCLRVEGHAGAALGQDMQAGEIVVDGDCGDFAGSGMHGGLIRVLGDAGHFLAGPCTMPAWAWPAEPWWCLAARATAQATACAVAWCWWAKLAARPAALACWPAPLSPQHCAGMPGLGLRRGSLVLLQAPELPITYNDSGMVDLTWLRLLARTCAAQIPDLLPPHAQARRHCGDLACGGQGEILVLAP